MIKHTEMQVVRDEHGRVLSSTTHEWPEPQPYAEQHAAAMKAVRDENAALRAKVGVLNATITALVAHHARQIEQIAQAWMDSTGERDAVALTQLQELPSVLAERDAMVIAQRDEQWREAQA